MFTQKDINLPNTLKLTGIAALVLPFAVACSSPSDNRPQTLQESVQQANKPEKLKVNGIANQNPIPDSQKPHIFGDSSKNKVNVVIAPQDLDSFESNAQKFDPNLTAGLNARESFKQPRVFLTNPVDLKLVQSKLGDMSVLGFRLEEGNVVFYPISNTSGYSQVDQSFDKIVLPEKGRVQIPLNKFSPSGQNTFKKENKIDAGGQQYLRLLQN